MEKGIRYFLCVIDLFSNYLWIFPLKYKKRITIVIAFQTFQTKRKPNKIRVDQGSDLCSIYFKKWLQENNIKMYSTLNERNSVVAERFIKTLKSNLTF